MLDPVEIAQSAAGKAVGGAFPEAWDLMRPLRDVLGIFKDVAPSWLAILLRDPDPPLDDAAIDAILTAWMAEPAIVLLAAHVLIARAADDLELGNLCHSRRPGFGRARRLARLGSARRTRTRRPRAGPLAA